MYFLPTSAPQMAPVLVFTALEKDTIIYPFAQAINLGVVLDWSLSFMPIFNPPAKPC